MQLIFHLNILIFQTFVGLNALLCSVFDLALGCEVGAALSLHVCARSCSRGESSLRDSCGRRLASYACLPLPPSFPPPSADCWVRLGRADRWKWNVRPLQPGRGERISNMQELCTSTFCFDGRRSVHQVEGDGGVFSAFQRTLGEFKSNVQETNSHTCVPVALSNCTGDVVSMQVEPDQVR